MIYRPLVVLLLLHITLVGCGSESRSAEVALTPTLPVGISKITKVESGSAKDTLTIPLIVFIIDDQQQTFSSKRTAAEVIQIQAKANEIWAPADIQFSVSEIRRVTVPLDMTASVIRRQFDDFFEDAQSLDLNGAFESPAVISAFYVQTIKGDNGLHPTGHSAYFIADDTLNHTGRTVAHELGHILGLEHTDNDPTKLMHSGANGVILTSHEIAKARKNAQKLQRSFRVNSI